MRLIDADAYIKYINLALNDAITEGTTIGIIQCMAIAKSIEDDLKNEKITPTIEPERKKGKWVLVTDRNGQHFECDKCGEWKYHQKQNFCGECGADMRGGQDDR